jgi:AcrR family transcriptional regulator
MLTLRTLTSMAAGVDTVNMHSEISPDRPYHHGRLRETLVAAGYELARADGPEAVILRAVSRASGVSHNAAYRHFADHRDLVNAVAEQCMNQLADLMRRRIAEVRVRDRRRRAAAELRAIGSAYIEFALTEPGLFRTAFAVRPDTPPAENPSAPSAGRPAATPADEAWLGPYELLGARLDTLVEVGILAAERRPGAEYAAWSAVHGMSMLLVDGPLRDLPDAERERAIDVVLDVVPRGL